MIALADHDYPTRSASGFIIRYILPRTGPPQLVGPLDRKEPFTMLAFGDFILAMGHGSPTELCGQNEQVVMDIDHIPDVNGKMIKLLSCETGQKLGPALIEAGAVGYQGYVDDYLWVCDADLSARPWSDKMAATSLMPVIDGLNALLDGKTAKEAFDIELCGYLINAEAEEDELIKSCLEFNHDNAVLLGAKDITISKRPSLLLPFKIIPPPPLIPLLITKYNL